MTGIVVLAFAAVTVMVLGRYLARAGVLIAVGAAQVAWTLLNAMLWAGCFVLRPRGALESLRVAIERAEAESAIRRLNA